MNFSFPPMETVVGYLISISNELLLFNPVDNPKTLFAETILFQLIFNHRASYTKNYWPKNTTP